MVPGHAAGGGLSDDAHPRLPAAIRRGRYRPAAHARHKGRGPLGCEKYDITEISGADDLSCPEGIIAESEKNASALFGTRRTFYSTEGSSQCVKAMLLLAARRSKSRKVLVGAMRTRAS